MGMRRRTGRDAQPWVTYAFAGGGYVKIGRSTAVMARLQVLEQGLPFTLKLIGVVRKDVEQDALLTLRRLGAGCRGEWFNDTPAVRRALLLLGFHDFNGAE